MAKEIRLQPVDVVVVGAGLGGAAFCARLSERAPRLRIACLERGGWFQRADLPAHRRDWQELMMSSWATSPNLRQRSGASACSADYAIDDSQSAFKPLMWSGMGGSTVNWAAHFPRLHPSDFRLRTQDGIAEDWPFSYFDLEPYYDLNDEAFGVAGLAGDPAYPPKKSRRMKPLPLGRLGRRAAAGFDRLGWHWWPVDAAINTVADGARGACNHCGPCQQGCANGAKSSTDITYLPRATRNGVDLRPHCVVREVVIEAGRATGVRYVDASGAEMLQPASVVVVAGNGVGTARLLLASGVASPALGRNLMFHPAAYVRGMFKDELDGPVGPIGCALYSHEFYETDPARGFKRGVHLQVTRENPLLMQAARLEPAWGGEAQRRLREEFRHSMAVLVLAEDLPEVHNRVVLADRMEGDGLPGVRVEYRLSEHSRRSLDFGLDRAEEMLRAAGAYRVVRVRLAPLAGWHLLGTARMGSDPGSSVTDAQGRCHAAPNIIVADGSLFPTVGAVNPGSTIGALALKLADDLAREAA